jgi:hypothetical protein
MGGRDEEGDHHRNEGGTGEKREPEGRGKEDGNDPIAETSFESQRDDSDIAVTGAR